MASGASRLDMIRIAAATNKKAISWRLRNGMSPKKRWESDEVDGGEQRQPHRRVTPREPIDENGAEKRRAPGRVSCNVWIGEASDLAQHRRQDRDAQASVVGILEPAHAPVAVGQGQLEHVVLALDIVASRVPAAH